LSLKLVLRQSNVINLIIKHLLLF